MFKKIISLKNIKQLNHKKAPTVEFTNLNLIYGRNGAGKSTICRLLNYINSGDVDGIKKLRSFECVDEVNIQMLFDIDSQKKLISINTLSDIPYKFSVFDEKFVANNVYTHDGVKSSQLVNYYEFCLGQSSVEKQEKIQSLKLKNDTVSSKISPIEASLKLSFPNKSIAEITKIKKFADGESALAIAQTELEDVKQTAYLKARNKLSKLNVEMKNIDFSCFNIELEQISRFAKEKVEEHMSANMTEHNRLWIEEGFKSVTATDNCPFCAQPLNKSEIFHLYQEFINESYTTAVDDFDIHSQELELLISSLGVQIEDQEQLAENNVSAMQSWSDKFESLELKFDFSEATQLSTSLILEFSRLVRAKKKDILAQADFNRFNQLYKDLSACLVFTKYNESVAEFNTQIDTFLEKLGTSTSLAADAKILEIQESIKRHSDDVVNLLDTLKPLQKSKDANERSIKVLRGEIEAEQVQIISLYKESINSLLEKFFSFIRIDDLGRDNKGKGGTTRFTPAIKFIDSRLSLVDDSDGSKLVDRVLSCGDKTSLALAFFLSKFQSKTTHESIVVLDDPMSSLDVHRRTSTVREIYNLFERGYQTFVLSHDPYFLSDIRNHSNLSNHAACFELATQFIDTSMASTENMQYCQSSIVHREDFEQYVMHSYQHEYNTLTSFIENPQEDSKSAVARSIRPILEANLRLRFPHKFTNSIWLGAMITMIRDETDQTSIMFDKNNKLACIEEINEFSKAYHHANGFDTQIQQLDIQELKRYAKAVYLFITGLN